LKERKYSSYSFSTSALDAGEWSAFVLNTVGIINVVVRFQVLTAASMKFRIVFWDVLMIPDDGGSTHL
jgi:hypothetical protein